MNPHVNTIANRLSLRPPQRASLEILARLCEILPLEKGADPAAALKAVQAEFPAVTDFERDFPSLCFALATGVGKTRLMGAFIAYLFRTERIRHFFVLAPNLTIYDKLIGDFTPNSPKYVFSGIAEFAVTPPEIITGDNYETGRGVRGGRLFESDVHVNIFNIGKITSLETPKGAVKTNVPKFRRLQEYIGQSYFDYLSTLDDLVLVMDESHRYRASAGMKAISELKPILGLELTATPQAERAGGTQAFRNVIYAYPLSNAMEDGFVKEPAVATRKNFDAKAYDDAGLERLKLEDGVRIHEETKVGLEVYARENDQPIVKPFMLVIARDVEHADALRKGIEDAAFFEGRYKGKVITVHSNLKGDEKDETIEQLIHVEKAGNPTEIVIHVNMLKEGWDVTNLYTIVPLRAANSQTLVEHSIGRGLRLPYGKRTGVDAVDRLTIVSHDKFQEIVDYANRPDSIIRGGLKVVYVSDEPSRVVVVQPEIMNRIGGGPGPAAGGAPGGGQRPLFATAKEQEAARTTLEVIHREYERLPRSRDLGRPEIQEEIVEKVKAAIAPAQKVMEGIVEGPDIPEVVKKTIALHASLSIDIPRIVVLPVGDVKRGYREFALDLSGVSLQPVEHEILIQELQSREQYLLASGTGIVSEPRPENYLVRGLMECDDISYDDHAELLYRLAGQVVGHLRSYLKSEDEVLNVLQYHQPRLVNLMHVQMQDHYEEKATTYEAHVSRGFTTLRPNTYNAASGETERDFRAPVEERQDIRRMLFRGFSKCLYPVQKFQSDPERRFAAVLENDRDVEKWCKPAPDHVRIYYRHGGQETPYEPDFVVEAKGRKCLCEVKAANEMTDPIVLEKAAAATQWCEYATNHELEHGGKPWSYLLIPHDVVADNKTLQGLAATFTRRVADAGASPQGQPGIRPPAPFRRAEPREEDKFRTCVPLLTLKAVAGAFGSGQAVEPDGWVEVKARARLRRGMFVAQVQGRSMEPRIPDGSWCLFSNPVEGSRGGRLLVVQHRDIHDPETGGSYTLKRYKSEKKPDGEGGWRHSVILLEPLNPEFAAIRLEDVPEDEVRVVAEFVAAL